VTEEMKPDQRVDWLPLVWTLLFCAWLFGVPWLMLQSVFSVPLSTGGVASDADLAQRDTLARWAATAAVTLPLVGVLLAAIARRKAPAIIFGIALLLSTVVVGYGLANEARHQPTPAPTNDHTICQEHSGGDNECPGG
jgi:hypothetical protein